MSGRVTIRVPYMKRLRGSLRGGTSEGCGFGVSGSAFIVSAGKKFRGGCMKIIMHGSACIEISIRYSSPQTSDRKTHITKAGR